jgi:pyruvate dehydrogenase E2 component (dihydrolipoamide acetyltransferase)
MTYESDAEGVLLEIVVGPGETAALGQPIAVVGAAGERIDVPSTREKAPAAGNGAAAATSDSASAAAGVGEARSARPARNGDATPAAAPPASGTRRVPASPLARRIASDLGVDLSAIQGTGPSGRIVRADVESAATSGTVATAAPPAPVAPPVSAPVERVAAEQRTESPPERAGVADARGDTATYELTRLQQTVARRMAESHATVPAFELRVDVDMSACVELRERLRELGSDPLPSYNDMIVKASAVALREFPRVNASYKDGRFEQYGRVNVGLAVAAQDALVVPTISDADERSLSAIARAARDLANKVREGTITPPELAGATFTVSNLGMFGIDSFTAVINIPQAAILAVGALAKRPVVDEHDRIVARPTLTLTLSCDHRILYGADGARFLARVRELLERPLLFAL